MLRVQASSSAAPGAAALADVGLPLTSHQRISASARRCGAAKLRARPSTLPFLCDCVCVYY